MSHYAVIGRIPGDDEDSCYTYQCGSVKEATNRFKENIYNDANLTEDDRERIRADYGSDVFITHVLKSETRILY